MKLKTLLIVLGVVALLTFSWWLAANAESRAVVDLEKLSPMARNEILDLQKEETKPADPEQWKKWAELGKGIGIAVAEVAQTLNVEVNAFIKTPAGKITVAMIAYKIIGKDVKRIILGLPIWAVLLTLIILSFRRFHMTERVVTKDEKKQIKAVTYIEKYKFNSNDAKTGSAVAHVGIFVVLNLVMALVLL